MTDEPSEFRIALVGCGEAGKTTIFKQARLKFAAQKEKHVHNDTNHRQIIRQNIRYNLILTIRTILTKCTLTDEHRERANRILAITEDELMQKDFSKYPGDNDGISKDIRLLWKESNVKQVVSKHYSSLHLLDNAKFFLDATHRVFRDGYTANEDDYVRDYVSTSGINRVDLLSFGLRRTVRLYDTGGQRSERRKVNSTVNVNMYSGENYSRVEIEHTSFVMLSIWQSLIQN